MLFHRIVFSRDKEGVLALANKGIKVQKPEDVLRNPYILEFAGISVRSKISSAAQQGNLRFTPINLLVCPNRPIRLPQMTYWVAATGLLAPDTRCTDTLTNHPCTVGQTSLIFAVLHNQHLLQGEDRRAAIGRNLGGGKGHFLSIRCTRKLPSDSHASFNWMDSATRIGWKLSFQSDAPPRFNPLHFCVSIH